MTDDIWPEPALTDPAEEQALARYEEASTRGLSDYEAREEGWPSTTTATAATVNRLDRVRDILRLEGLAAAATRRAAEHRALLDAEARAEYQREGAAPTWRMQDIGSVTLPVSQEAVVVADIDALTKWCKERHPEQIRTREEIWPGYQTHLLTNCVVDGDLAVDPESGEPVPGLAVRKGGEAKTLAIRAETGVKHAYAQHGARWLDEILGGGS